MNTNLFRCKDWLYRTLFLVAIGFLSPQTYATTGDGIWDADRDPNVGGNESVDSDSVFHAAGEAINGADGTPLPANFIESFFVDDYNPDPGNDPTLHNDGQKDGQYVKDWECNPPKSAPPKNNLVHGLATYYANGSEFIFGSASKDADNGTNYLGFWLFLDPNVGCTPNYAADGNTFLGANANGLFAGSHVDGDWLLISDYTNGGGVASFNAYRWNDPDYLACLNAGGTKSSCANLLENGDEVLGHYDFGAGECETGGKGNGPNPNAPISHNNAADECGPVYTSIDCNPQNPGENNVICATTNTDAFGPVTAAWNVLNNNGGGGDILDPPTYFEFAINVKTLVETPPEGAVYPGQEFCGGQFMIESRTSAELFGASLKDYILSDFRVCGDLKVVKVTDPAEDPPTTDFAFTVTGPGGDITGLADPDEVLGDGEYFEITDLSVGNYNISEDHPLPTGWILDDINCENDQGGDEGTDDGVTGVDISLGAEKITCTFYNDKPPTLRLKKIVVNDDGGTADPDEWTLNAGSLINTAGVDQGDDTALTSFVTATAGVGYALSETGGPSGYSEGSFSCDGGTLVGQTITLENGDNVTCTVTNNDIAPTLRLKKIVVNDDGGTADPDEWTLNAGSLINTAGVDQGDDTALTSFVTATAGVGYALSETGGPSGYSEGSFSCDGGNLVGQTITLALDDDVTCTVTNNDIAPKLKLVKVVNNGDPSWSSSVADDWTLTADASAPFDGRDKSVAGGSDSLTMVFANNAYALAESGPDGYDASSWDCEDSSGDYAGQSGSSVTLGLADEVTCTITNTARGMVELLKYFNGTLVTTETFNFTLTGPESLNETDSTPPNPVDFGGAKLIPDTTYTICETGLIAGMTAFWSLDTTEPPDGVGDTDLPFVGAQTGSLWEVYNPDAPAEDLGNRCVDFQVGVGEVVNFVVNNVTPQGDARTPGYWKNWSSCSNGNQFDKATGEYLGGVFDRHWTIDEVLTEASNPPLDPIHLTAGGVIIGDLELLGDPDGDVYDGDSDANCEDAVLVMSSRDLNNPKKNHSSDMAYKLARYLLPFLANQMAGAYSCPYAADVAHESQELLADLNFNGTGDYLDNRSLKQDPSLEIVLDLASFYHGILGQYVENDPSLNCGDTLEPDEEYPPAP